MDPDLKKMHQLELLKTIINTVTPSTIANKNKNNNNINKSSNNEGRDEVKLYPRENLNDKGKKVQDTDFINTKVKATKEYHPNYERFQAYQKNVISRVQNNIKHRFQTRGMTEIPATRVQNNNPNQEILKKENRSEANEIFEHHNNQLMRQNQDQICAANEITIDFKTSQNKAASQEQKDRIIQIQIGGKSQVNSTQTEKKNGNQDNYKNIKNSRSQHKLSEIKNSKLTSEKCKNDIIFEFERLKNNTGISNIETKEDIKFENSDDKIIQSYKGTKTKEFTRWRDLILFLKLTKNMKPLEIAKVLNKNSESFRRELVGLNRAYKFLQVIGQKSYSQISIPLSVFQKINTKDWNGVLMKF